MSTFLPCRREPGRGRTPRGNRRSGRLELWLPGLLAILVSSGVAATAQETNRAGEPALRADTNAPAGPTNAPGLEAGLTGRSPAAPADPLQTNGLAAPPGPGRSNNLAQPSPTGSTNLSTEPANPASSNSTTPANAPLPSSSGRPDYNSFRLIADRNIFNPNRFPRSGPFDRRDFRRPARVDSFSLVGTMSYEKGLFAFFDGSGSQYRKTLQPSGVIAGFKVIGIGHDRVALASGTNTIVLRIGMQMRREEEGEWALSDRSELATTSSPGPGPGFGDASPPRPSSSEGGSETVAAPGETTATSTNAEPAAAGGSDSDILKRLMERREKEMNK